MDAGSAVPRVTGWAARQYRGQMTGIAPLIPVIRLGPPHSTAMDPMEEISMSSKMGFHFCPPSVDFHTPPEAVAT